MKLSDCDFAKGVFISLLGLALASPAIAAESDEDEGYFEEIVVTAERTAKNVMDTPMTITGFTEDMLKQFHVQDRDKLQLLVPGLQSGDLPMGPLQVRFPAYLRAFVHNSCISLYCRWSLHIYKWFRRAVHTHSKY